MAARIFSVADVWDALRSGYPYRKAWPDERILAHIREQADKLFNLQCVEIFMKMMAR